MRLTAPLIALLLLACGEPDPEWCSRYCDAEGRESRPVKCLECPVVEAADELPHFGIRWHR